ncbi:MAG: universal stress protein [Candidatus Schekmanbacteria bacterium]|nr:MAG: universal stress protein [Candidatus Schekmanbacteria bacterium]
MENLFKRILVPVDFSDGSMNSFNLAEFFSKDRGSKIILVHIISEPLITDPIHSSEYFTPKIIADLKEELEEKIQEEYVEKSNLKNDIETVVLRGYPPTEIISLIEKTNADLVVMGTHGRKGLAHLLLGSVTEKVIRASKVPVITMRVDTVIAPESYNIKKILVPYDFSQLSEKSLHLAERIANFYHSEIDLVFVNQPITYYPYYLSDYISEEDVLEKIDEEIKEKLEALANREESKNIKVDTFVKRGEPYEKIIELSEELASNLIVMGTHGRSGIAHVVIGSVAERVIRSSHIPVMTVRF